jgi:hypothetical protein
MVNHYYFYCVDEDFGPFFLKFCSYFHYNAKLCPAALRLFKQSWLGTGQVFSITWWPRFFLE